MKSHRFIDYTYLEIKDLIDEGRLAVLPTGCTEQQGPHLPVDFDTWLAEAVALEAARHTARCHGIRALVLPAMPFGPTPTASRPQSRCIDARTRSDWTGSLRAARVRWIGMILISISRNTQTRESSVTQPKQMPNWGAGFGTRSYRPRQRYSEMPLRELVERHLR